MARFVLNRLAFSLPTLLLVALTVFVIMRAVPGDPIVVMLGDAATPDIVAATRAQYGLDRPLPFQFLLWLKNIATGDFGQSIQNKAEVLPLILSRFAVSAQIVLVAVMLASVIAVPLGLLAGWRQGSRQDFATVALATLLMSVPSFWMGLMLLLAFGLELRWLPIVGYVPWSESARGAVLSLILPIATLVLVEVGVLIRMARSSTVDVARLEYVLHAKAKGLAEQDVLFRHVLPNAFAPTWTLVGLILGNLLGGIAVVETVFTIPGLGRLIVDGIFARDYPVIQGCLLFTAAIYVLVNTLVDLAYPLFDPRVAVQ
jgi:peptide/nickel transport system permease protein